MKVTLLAVIAISAFPFKVNAQVGINTTSPEATLDVAGNMRVRTMEQVAGSAAITPVYSDANGVLVKASNSSTYGELVSVSVDVASGATETLVDSLVERALYKVFVTVGNNCGYNTYAEYLAFTFPFNSNFSIVGTNGLFSGGSSKTPTFTETNRTTTVVTWSGKPGCADGGNSTALDYTLTMPSAGTINIINNGNVSRTYRATFTRIN